MRRPTVVGLAFVVQLAASCWLPTVRADDRAAGPQAAAELAARKRILANWRARQDRIKSFYVARKPGPNDPMPKWARAGLAGAHQLWVASDGRFRQEFPIFNFARQVVSCRRIEAFDGKYLRTLWTSLYVPSAELLRGKLPATRCPVGRLEALEDLSDRRQNGPDGAEMLAFRPLESPYGDWTLENSRVTSQNAIVAGQHYVKIAKADAESGIIEACWVDPQRSDLVIHFQRDFPTGLEEWTSLEYKQDPRHGWVPARWHYESGDMGDVRVRKSTGEAIVTEYKINGDFPSETFRINFPAAAIVHDEEAEQDYFVRRDGSQRVVNRSQLGKSVTYEQLVKEDTTRPAKP